MACSFAFARGEIQTSFHAGGIASDSIRSIVVAFVTSLPRESTYRNRPLLPFLR